MKLINILLFTKKFLVKIKALDLSFERITHHLIEMQLDRFGFPGHLSLNHNVSQFVEFCFFSWIQRIPIFYFDLGQIDRTVVWLQQILELKLQLKERLVNCDLDSKI